MDQKKIGAFLKTLRKERALTQEQLAERFGVTGRSVSRWENGNNLPDLSILIGLADYYDLEIREILEGERSDPPMHQTTKEDLAAAAAYSGEEKNRLLKRMHGLFLVGLAGLCAVLAIGALGLEDQTPCREISAFCQGMTLGMTALGVVFTGRHAAAIRNAKLRLLKKGK